MVRVLCLIVPSQWTAAAWVHVGGDVLGRETQVEETVEDITMEEVRT